MSTGTWQQGFRPFSLFPLRAVYSASQNKQPEEVDVALELKTAQINIVRNFPNPNLLFRS
jgi:hypothetical protein